MNSKLFDSPLFNYALFRENDYTKDVDVNTLYGEITSSEIVERFKAGENIDYLVDEINTLNGDIVDGEDTFTIDSPYASLNLYTDGLHKWFIY